MGKVPHGLGGWGWPGAAAPCPSRSFCSMSGSSAACTQSWGGFVAVTGGKCKCHSDLWCGQVNQIFFPSLLSLQKSSVVSFCVLPAPGVSRDCFHPGRRRALPLHLDCLSLGQVSPDPLPTSPFTSWKRSRTLGCTLSFLIAAC